MAKRVCAVLLAVAMLVTMLAAGVSIVRASAETAVTFTVATVEGAKGDIVEIPVSVSENSYIVNMDLFVHFDSAQLALVDTYYPDVEDDSATAAYAVNTAVLKAGWMYLGAETDPGEFRFVAATGGSGLTAGGEVLRLAFEILTDEVEKIEVSVSADPCVANNGDADYDVSYTPVNGGVTVETILIGDFDANGTVNMRDVMQLYKAVSDGTVMTDYQLSACDYDGSGGVNMRDVMNIYRTVSTGV